jgi:hypothetical protein
MGGAAYPEGGADSALTDRDLEGAHHNLAVSKAVRHLWGIHDRRRNCLSVKKISRANARKEISEMENGATAWLALQASLPTD